MSQVKSTSSLTLNLYMFGVRCFWRGNLNLRFEKENLAAGQELDHRLVEVIEPVLKRQRRKEARYWDAMTYLEQGRLPKAVVQLPETQLAMEIITAMGRGTLRDRTIMELIEFPALEAATTRLAWFDGDDAHVFGAIPRLHPKRLVLNSKQQLRPKGPGAYRLLELDMHLLEMPSTRIEWDRLMVLSVLVQLRANFEIECETGIQRVAKCQRRACAAWFQPKRMSGRQRFCGTYCRVANSRE